MDWWNNQPTDWSSPVLVSEPVRPPGIIIGSCRPERREMMADHLEDQGFAVWTAGSGVAALETYVTHTGEIDLLLIDAYLPDLPAYAFFPRLRRFYPGAVCFFLVDRTTEWLGDKARALGARVLPWPMPLTRLCAVLKDSISAEPDDPSR